MNDLFYTLVIVSVSLLLFYQPSNGQGIDYGREPDTNITWRDRGVSVARDWNEGLMFAIRRDLTRPTVHARNLFHISGVMWDCWAAYSGGKAKQYFHKEQIDVTGWTEAEIEAARNESISYGAYTMLAWRFRFTYGFAETSVEIKRKMTYLGYDYNFKDLTAKTPAGLGLRVANTTMEYGLQDGSNEAKDYDGYPWYNAGKGPINPALAPASPKTIDQIKDPNKWQPINVNSFMDQSGVILGTYPPFVGPHWGRVSPFALTQDDMSKEHPFVYMDPGRPANLHPRGATPTEETKWYMGNHSYVAELSGVLDPDDGVLMDISPASMGNNRLGYNDGSGHWRNPHTGKPYPPQVVPRGDYYRILAEFWADGPHSETPPGHWNVLLNYVSYHPHFKRRLHGVGAVVDPLQWDVMSYFALNGAMHDAAIVCWSQKGFYDSSRPLTAIRYMAYHGQSTDPKLPRYHHQGYPLKPGVAEIIPLEARKSGHHLSHLSAFVDEIAIFAWRNHAAARREGGTGYAGVGWMLAQDWWPYQRDNFVNPPFAGFTSGHSTFSRAAAEVMTLLTGDKYWPGGVGIFKAPANNFLVFEKGPSVSLELQWATYYDAADECSMSRIYGGIHPRMDDIPGRFQGAIIGPKAFWKAVSYFPQDDVYFWDDLTRFQVFGLIFGGIFSVIAVVAVSVVSWRRRRQGSQSNYDDVIQMRPLSDALAVHLDGGNEDEEQLPLD